MLQSISWNEFLTAIAVVSFLYYGITGLIFYKSELDNFFRNVLARQVGQGQGEGGDGAGHSISVMGPPKKRDDGKETSDDQEIIFAPETTGAEFDQPSSDGALVGIVADLGEEIKLLAPTLSSSSKDQIQQAFCGLLRKYVRLSSTSYRPTINLLVAETIAGSSVHRISVKEIDAWWSSGSNTKHNKE